MTQEQKQNYTRRIAQANETQMITILYSMTLDYLADARNALMQNQTAEYEIQLTRAQNCINELIRSLDLGYAIANNLLQLYIFAKRELIAASVKRDPEYIDHVTDIFDKMYACYCELEKMNPAPAVISGAQTVYAGLTYGPGNLNETVQDPYRNRGYEA